MPVVADIAAAVVTAVTGIVTGATVKRRKVPTLPVDAAPPEVVVSVSEEGFTQYQDFEGNVFIAYPVAVTIITGGGSNLEDDDTLRGWRESVRKAVDKPSAFASVSQFHSVTSEGRMPFNTAALSKDFNYSVQLFTVTALESRN